MYERMYTRATPGTPASLLYISERLSVRMSVCPYVRMSVCPYVLYRRQDGLTLRAEIRVIGVTRSGGVNRIGAVNLRDQLFSEKGFLCNFSVEYT